MTWGAEGIFHYWQGGFPLKVSGIRGGVLCMCMQVEERARSTERNQWTLSYGGATYCLWLMSYDIKAYVRPLGKGDLGSCTTDLEVTSTGDRSTKMSGLGCYKAFWEVWFIEAGPREVLLCPLCQAHCFILEKSQSPTLWILCSLPLS